MKAALIKTPDLPVSVRSPEHGRFDVAIVGGGAMGCALAWESASRGLSTALLERDDFGAATSANSLSIVHGGLRYLQSLDFRRARGSSRERAIMLRIASHLVSPLECVIPTTRSFKRGRLAFMAGLGVNRLVMAGQNRGLAPDHKIRGGGIYSSTRLEKMVPGISMQAISGAAYWDDGCMKSGERLALAFAQSAHERGALVLNHVDVERSLIQDGQINGVVARSQLHDECFAVEANVVFDCRGVGVAAQPDLFGEVDLGIEFIKAVNIVIGDRGLECAVGAPGRDERGDPVHSRLIFARPEGRSTIVGTWYFERSSRADQLLPEELEEILQAINGAFPSWRVTPDDVVDVQVGYQPRKQMATTGLFPIEHPLVIESTSVNGPAGLWHIHTEKWTTVRALAERLINMLSRKGNMAVAPSRTHVEPLCGGEPLALTAGQSELLSQLGEEKSSRLLSLYGARAARLLDCVIADPALAESVPFARTVIKGELHYVLKNEFARTPQDVIRRLNLNLADRPGPDAISYLEQFIETFEGLPDSARQPASI